MRSASLVLSVLFAAKAEACDDQSTFGTTGWFGTQTCQGMIDTAMAAEAFDSGYEACAQWFALSTIEDLEGPLGMETLGGYTRPAGYYGPSDAYVIELCCETCADNGYSHVDLDDVNSFRYEYYHDAYCTHEISSQVIDNGSCDVLDSDGGELLGIYFTGYIGPVVQGESVYSCFSGSPGECGQAQEAPWSWEDECSELPVNFCLDLSDSGTSGSIKIVPLDDDHYEDHDGHDDDHDGHDDGDDDDDAPSGSVIYGAYYDAACTQEISTQTIAYGTCDLVNDELGALFGAEGYFIGPGFQNGVFYSCGGYPASDCASVASYPASTDQCSELYLDYCLEIDGWYLKFTSVEDEDHDGHDDDHGDHDDDHDGHDHGEDSSDYDDCAAWTLEIYTGLFCAGSPAVTSSMADGTCVATPASVVSGQYFEVDGYTHWGLYYYGDGLAACSDTSTSACTSQFSSGERCTEFPIDTCFAIDDLHTLKVVCDGGSDSGGSNAPAPDNVVIELIAAGTVDDYPPSVTNSIAASVAAELPGVSANDVTVEVESASVKIIITIATDESASTDIVETMEAAMSSPQAASNLLGGGIQVESVENIGTDGGSSKKEDELPIGIIAGAGGGGALVIIIIAWCLCCQKKKAAAPPPMKQAQPAQQTMVPMQQAAPPKKAVDFGARFDTETGKAIPQFDTETGVQNW